MAMWACKCFVAKSRLYVLKRTREPWVQESAVPMSKARPTSSWNAWAECWGMLPCDPVQARTSGITEFVPLPFVHMEAPVYLKVWRWDLEAVGQLMELMELAIDGIDGIDWWNECPTPAASPRAIMRSLPSTCFHSKRNYVAATSNFTLIALTQAIAAIWAQPNQVLLRAHALMTHLRTVAQTRPAACSCYSGQPAPNRPNKACHLRMQFRNICAQPPCGRSATWTTWV